MYLSDATKPRLQQFLEARQRACVCGGRWLHHVRESLAMNRINVAELCSAVMDSMEAGRSESVQVPTLTGRFGGEGTQGRRNRSLIFCNLLTTVSNSFLNTFWKRRRDSFWAGQNYSPPQP